MKTFAIQIIAIFFLAACQKEDTTTEPIKEDESIVTQSNCQEPYTTIAPDINKSIIDINDNNFEKQLSKFDSDNKLNGKILKFDALKIDTLGFRGYAGRDLNSKSDVKSVNGIQYFENLKYFICLEELIDTLDVRFNKELSYLRLEGSFSPGGYTPQGSFIVLGENDKLKTLILSYTRIKSLDLRGIPNLQTLEVQNNFDLKYIYISNINAVKKNWIKLPSTVYVVCK
jgi:hypothetical protein